MPDAEKVVHRIASLWTRAGIATVGELARFPRAFRWQGRIYVAKRQRDGAVVFEIGRRSGVQMAHYYEVLTGHPDDVVDVIELPGADLGALDANGTCASPDRPDQKPVAERDKRADAHRRRRHFGKRTHADAV